MLRKNSIYGVRHLPIAVNLTPMIDVSFLLLIFFLVTATFERAEGLLTSKLPQEAEGAPAVALPLTPIVVRLERTGPDDNDFAIRMERFDGVPQTFSELAGFLGAIQQQPGFDQQTPVVIMAQDDVAWDHVVACWNAAVRAGYQNLVFGVNSE